MFLRKGVPTFYFFLKMELVVSMAQIFPTVYKQVSITDHADDIAKKSKYLP